MRELRLSRRADTDLADIADFTIATFGTAQARKYRDQLRACFAFAKKYAARPLMASPTLCTAEMYEISASLSGFSRALLKTSLASAKVGRLPARCEGKERVPVPSA